jgi:hypothetical protein
VFQGKKTFGVAAALVGGVLIGTTLAAPVAEAVSSVASSISGSTLKNHSVAGTKLKNRTLTSRQVKNRSLTGTQIKPNSLTGSQIKESTLAVVPKATALAFLPSGHSESGVYAQGGGTSTSGFLGVSITFPQPLAKTIVHGNVIWVTAENPNTNCPGVGQAARGYLCLYDGEHAAVTFDDDVEAILPTSPGTGAIAWWFNTDANSYLAGTWTVTAP